MPLVNADFWRSRFGKGSPCWSGDRWLDAEHGVISRRAFRRIWPADAERRHWSVLDVGCGDGAWTEWMRHEFDVNVMGVDGLEWPGADSHGFPFHVVDAEKLNESVNVVFFMPDMVVFMNSLTCIFDPFRALRAAAEVTTRILCFDNFQQPTPAYWADLPHRKPVRYDDLVEAMDRLGFSVEKAVTADWWHRKLFLHSPKWLHPLVAVASGVLDIGASIVVPPRRARHSAVLFRKRSESYSMGYKVKENK